MAMPDPAFDIAYEMARLADRAIARHRAAGDDESDRDIDAEIDAELRHAFPTATRADFERARLILKERLDMFVAEHASDPVDLVLRGGPMPSAEGLFPKPDKVKS
jgi:hypothetical protein